MYLNKYKGMHCTIKVKDWAATLKGIVIEVEENWVNIESKRKDIVINSNHIQFIEIEKN